MSIVVIAFSFVVCSCLVQSQPVNGSLATLTEAEYDRLPPLFQLDAYSRCLRVRGGQYCYVTAKLFGDNDLYKTLQEYSAYNKTHYDHTYMYRGVCAQTTCGEHLENSTDLTTAIEACLNASMARDYQLSTRVVRSICSKNSESRWDGTDYGFLALVLVLLGLNVLGSLFDFCGTQEEKTFGRKLLHSFSIKRNWNQLVAPNSNVTDPMLRRLKCLSCFKTICTLVVLLAHSPLDVITASNNPIFMESTYHFLPYHILLCGPLIVQTFFLISGFLTAYNMLTSGRQHWWMLPKKVLLRWLRLTPPFALVTFFVMTWQRHIGDGPLWKSFVMAESDDCRRDWWLNLLYIQNYVDHSQCMAHAWYLAADMQLSILGLVIFCVFSSARARKTAIGVVFLVGLLTPPAVMVLLNLSPILIVSPQMAVNMFVEDPTFNSMYKRTHTNLACYAMGMGLAYLVYNVRDSDIGSQTYKKFRLLYVMALPLELVTILSGVVFYMEDVVVPQTLRAVYCSAIKPLFGLLICVHIFFTVVKVDRVCRSFVNWGGWVVLARLTYCTYVVHVSFIRTSTAINDELSRSSLYRAILKYLSLVAASFLLAAVMNLLVEAPIGHVVKLCFDNKKKQPSDKPVSVDTSSKETIDIKM